MRKLLATGGAIAALMLAGAANAADMPIKAPVVEVWSWSGFYGGVHFGSAWGQKEWTQNIRTDANADPIRQYNELQCVGAAAAPCAPPSMVARS
jgi:opacity protein-like surface antigen